MTANHERDPGGGEAEPAEASPEGEQEAHRRSTTSPEMPAPDEVLDGDLPGADPEVDPLDYPFPDDWATSIGLVTGLSAQVVDPPTDGQAVIDRLGHHGLMNDGA